MFNKLILFCTLLTTLAFLGFSVSAFAGKDCVREDTRPKCNLGGGGDDHEDPPAQFCAEFISGGFYFGKQTVIRNNRGNDYYPSPYPNTLDMSRPDNVSLQGAWDTVFATCPALGHTEPDLAPNMNLHVSDRWSIGNGGANSIGIPGSPVAVSLRNAYTYPNSDIEVNLHLVGELPFGGFPTATSGPYNSVLIELDEFKFYVMAHGNESCKIVEKFSVLEVDPSVLEMTYGPCGE